MPRPPVIAAYAWLACASVCLSHLEGLLELLHLSDELRDRTDIDDGVLRLCRWIEASPMHRIKPIIAVDLRFMGHLWMG